MATLTLRRTGERATVTDGDSPAGQDTGLPGTGRLEILDQACESFSKDPASWPVWLHHNRW